MVYFYNNTKLKKKNMLFWNIVYLTLIATVIFSLSLSRQVKLYLTKRKKEKTFEKKKTRSQWKQ